MPPHASCASTILCQNGERSDAEILLGAGKPLAVLAFLLVARGQTAVAHAIAALAGADRFEKWLLSQQAARTCVASSSCGPRDCRARDLGMSRTLVGVGRPNTRGLRSSGFATTRTRICARRTYPSEQRAALGRSRSASRWAEKGLGLGAVGRPHDLARARRGNGVSRIDSVRAAGVGTRV
jgi:hypothetical protein